VTTIALTGATGFIGGVLLEHFMAAGCKVRALYRPSSSPRPTHNGSVQWQVGALDDADSLLALVAGADAVVHCAGAVRGITLEQFREVNTDGVARILEAATARQVPRFLLISSLAAREPDLSAYALSKKLGEDVLAGYGHRIAWDILRPPAVYGPGDREMRPLLQWIKRGVVPVIGGMDNRFSLLYADDLATAASRLLNVEKALSGCCFELHDGHPGGYTWRQIAAMTARLNGREPHCIQIPKRLLQLLGSTNAFLARLVGYRPMLSPGKVRELLHPDWSCDNTAIAGAIGWQPQVQFTEGMRRLFY